VPAAWFPLRRRRRGARRPGHSRAVPSPRVANASIMGRASRSQAACCGRVPPFGRPSAEPGTSSPRHRAEDEHSTPLHSSPVATMLTTSSPSARRMDSMTASSGSSARTWPVHLESSAQGKVSHHSPSSSSTTFIFRDRDIAMSSSHVSLRGGWCGKRGCLRQGD
jgi:hypothetical protein